MRTAPDRALLGDVGRASFAYGFRKAKWRLRTSDKMPACRRCPYVFTCRGGCAVEAMEAHGSYFREACAGNKEAFDQVASHVAGRRWEETGETELSASLRGPLDRLGERERETLLSTRDANEMLELLKAAGFVEPLAS